MKEQPLSTEDQAAPSSTIQIALKINGATRTLEIEPRVSLLDALREHLHLTGTKKGCNQGACGACTVLCNGERILSCLTLAGCGLVLSARAKAMNRPRLPSPNRC